MGNMCSQLPTGDEVELNSIRDAIKRDKIWDAQQGYDGTWLAAPAFVPIALEAYASIVPGDNQVCWRQFSVISGLVLIILSTISAVTTD
jgi:malate synthase